MSETKRLEQFAREYGVRNPEDIYDQPSFEEIDKEIQDEIDRHNTNIIEHFKKEQIPQELIENLEAIRRFCTELSNAIKSAFIESLRAYRREHGRDSEVLIDFLIKNKLDLPRFDISYGEESNNRLHDLGLSRYYDKLGKKKCSLNTTYQNL